MNEYQKSRIYLLIKIFDKEEYADAFLQRGEIFCKPIGDFKKIENDDARGDAYECVTDWLQPKDISLVISHKNENGIERSFPIQDLAGPVIMQNNGFDRLNIYCMYAIKIPEFQESYETEEERTRVIEKINGMLKERSTLSKEAAPLGAFAVVIYQVESFINKVKQVSGEQGYSCKNGSVQYYDPETFHGSFKGLAAAYRKRNTYAHQNEYRFVFDSDKPEGTKIIHLGSLEGIGFKIPTRDINETLKIELKTDRDF